MGNKTILTVDNITKSFPGVKALDGVFLDVKEGEVHALCGENGAGKSTLMKIIAGVQKQTSGKLIVDGKEVTFNSTKEAEKHGIVMIYQEFNLINDLSVAENMYLGRLPKNHLGIVDWKKTHQLSKEMLNKIGLDIDTKTKVRDLSVALSQMVEIAKSLTVGAKLIIMDEPTAALTNEEIETLFEIINDLKKKGFSILYISHRMDEIFRISDRITVFRDGKYIDTKNVNETNYDEIVSMMVGKNIDNLYPERHYEKKDTVLELKNITGKNVNNVDLKLHKGEILGITGLLGSGAIELSKIIYGANELKDGEVFVNGEKKDTSTPKKALKAGIGLVSDDRKREGLVLSANVQKNISLSSFDKISNLMHIDRKREQANVNKQVENLNIKISSTNQLVSKLSGGNQQKVVFAKVLEANPDILILDEPTRGVDVGAKAEIYNIMNRITEEGKSIILISTDLPEVIGMSDRVIVMRESRVVLEMEKSKLNQETILAYASGGTNDE